MVVAALRAASKAQRVVSRAAFTSSSKLLAAGYQDVEAVAGYFRSHSHQLEDTKNIHKTSFYKVSANAHFHRAQTYIIDI